MVYRNKVSDYKFVSGTDNFEYFADEMTEMEIENELMSYICMNKIRSIDSNFYTDSICLSSS
jgi:hypothetical protein